jgi:hypothetical protein
MVLYVFIAVPTLAGGEFWSGANRVFVGRFCQPTVVSRGDHPVANVIPVIGTLPLPTLQLAAASRVLTSPNSTLPTEPTQLTLPVLQILLLLISELSLPLPFLRRLYESFLPILSDLPGLGFLGIAQVVLGVQVLSRFVERFEEVSAWLLVIVGVLNAVAVSGMQGLVLRGGSVTDVEP